jgi:hypothetical protein
MTRGVVTAAYWMNSPVHAWKIVDTRPEGRDWLKSLLGV